MIVSLLLKEHNFTLNKLLHLPADRYTLNLSTHKQSEVDLRVAQELKNNKDFIYQTNQSINQLREQIATLQLQKQQMKNKLESQLTVLEIQFEHLSEKVSDNIKSCLHRIGNAESAFTALQEVLITELNKLKESAASQENVKQLYTSIDEELRSVKLNVQNIKSFCLGAITQLAEHTNRELCNVKQSIPEELDLESFEKKINQLFDVVKVDYSGVLQELNLIKKALHYDEKKFENLYTLIERLKAGKS